MLNAHSGLLKALIAAVTLTIAALSLTGCAASHKTAQTPAPLAPARHWNPSPGSAALVVMSDDDSQLDSSATWEHGRRDATLGSVNGPFITVFGAAQVRQFERLSTVNGRPRDNSWTTSRSTQVIIQP